MLFPKEELLVDIYSNNGNVNIIVNNVIRLMLLYLVFDRSLILNLHII